MLHDCWRFTQKGLFLFAQAQPDRTNEWFAALGYCLQGTACRDGGIENCKFLVIISPVAGTIVGLKACTRDFSACFSGGLSCRSGE